MCDRMWLPVVGRKDMNDHSYGSRTVSSWLSLLRQDDPPLYTDDEVRRLNFLQDELRRLETQRQVRLSLIFLERYDLVRQTSRLVDLSHQQIALDERPSKMTLSHCVGTVAPCPSEDAVQFRTSKHNFMSAPALPTDVTTLTQPCLTRKELPPSTASILPPILADKGDGLSLDASLALSPATEQSYEDRHDHYHEKDPSSHEAQEIAGTTDIIPALIQQYSVRGLEMVPFPLKLHAVLANPRYHHVICWLPDGKSWKVIDSFLLERFVISRYFCHAKYSSFMRQVNGWGFARRSSRRGPGKGKSYFHVDFVRDDPERCLSMLRRRKAKKGS